MCMSLSHNYTLLDVSPTNVHPSSVLSPDLCLVAISGLLPHLPSLPSMFCQ